ncbi:MAG TPA: hypothetical protein VEA18_00555 [Candidatus Kapabacteria bacterium]|nr:hypothetical protein [Candidatus Kapabacteria bacterium]
MDGHREQPEYIINESIEMLGKEKGKEVFDSWCIDIALQEGDEDSLAAHIEMMKENLLVQELDNEHISEHLEGQSLPPTPENIHQLKRAIVRSARKMFEEMDTDDLEEIQKIFISDGLEMFDEVIEELSLAV